MSPIQQALQAAKERQNSENRDGVLTESEAEQLAIEKRKEYQKGQREENRKKLGLSNSELSKKIHKMDYDELDEIMKERRSNEIREITKTSKMNVHEVALVQKAIIITGSRSSREMLVDFALKIVNDYEEKLAKETSKETE